MLPPSTLAFLVGSGALADARGCGIVSPLLQNGVPSVEMFAEEFLDTYARNALYECFADSSAEFMGVNNTELEPLPQPWDPVQWNEKVQTQARNHWLAQKGLHPVRT